MTLVCSCIGVAIVCYFVGYAFGAMSRDKEIDEKDLTIAEYMGENRRLKEHCQFLEEKLNLPPEDSHPTDIPFI